MHEEIVSLARSVSGAGENQLQALEALCLAAEEEWTARLREGLSPQDCGPAFRCAAAFTAAAGLITAKEEGPLSFTAGSVTVRGRSAGDRTCRSHALLAEARQLMAPYTGDGSFAFLGVRG